MTNPEEAAAPKIGCIEAKFTAGDLNAGCRRRKAETVDHCLVSGRQLRDDEAVYLLGSNFALGPNIVLPKATVDAMGAEAAYLAANAPRVSSKCPQELLPEHMRAPHEDLKRWLSLANAELDSLGDVLGVPNLSSLVGTPEMETIITAARPTNVVIVCEPVDYPVNGIPGWKYHLYLDEVLKQSSMNLQGLIRSLDGLTCRASIKYLREGLKFVPDSLRTIATNLHDSPFDYGDE